MALGWTLWNFYPMQVHSVLKDSWGPSTDFWLFLHHSLISKTLPSTSNCLPELQSAFSIQQDHSGLPAIPLPAPNLEQTSWQSQDSQSAHLVRLPGLRDDSHVRPTIRCLKTAVSYLFIPNINKNSSLYTTKWQTYNFFKLFYNRII